MAPFARQTAPSPYDRTFSLFFRIGERRCPPRPVLSPLSFLVSTPDVAEATRPDFRRFPPGSDGSQRACVYPSQEFVKSPDSVPANPTSQISALTANSSMPQWRGEVRDRTPGSATEEISGATQIQTSGTWRHIFDARSRCGPPSLLDRDKWWKGKRHGTVPPNR